MPFLMFRIVTVILKLTRAASELENSCNSEPAESRTNLHWGISRFELTDVFLHTVNIGRLFLPREL